MTLHCKPKILIFIDWFVPGYKAGGPIRSVANMIDQLSDNYDFWLVTRNTDFLEKTPYKNIESDKWIKVAENQHCLYLSGKELTIKRIKSIIKKTNCNIIYINGIYSFYFSLLPLIIANSCANIKIIVASRGMLSPQSLGVKTLKKKLFLTLARILKIYKKSIFHASSETELKQIKQLNLKPISILIAPNFHNRINEQDIKLKNKEVGKLSLLSIARISPEKNTLYAIECLLNYPYNGEIEFDLYGPIYNTTYWQECQKLINKLPENIKVRYKGELDNTKINNVLENYHFLFLPSTGENYGHSIIESLLCACPVIISNTTPWDNLKKANVGWDLDLNNQALFAKVIQEALSMNNSSYEKMQKSTNDYVKTKIDTKKIVFLYKQLFNLKL